MPEKIYLHFLILCGILCQGIIGSIANNVTRESSDFLVRKRRVISHLPGGLNTTPIEIAKYMINIKANNRAHCAGAILSHYTAITSAPCVVMDKTVYRVFSGQTYENRGSVHYITSKDVHYGTAPHEHFDGIALITVDPPFEYNLRTEHIDLYVGPLPTDTIVTVRGWGCSYPPHPGPSRNVQRALRTINLPIMDHAQCRNTYRGHFEITEKHLCTYDQQQYCARTDAGAPLIVNNRLAGIHVWKGEHGRRNPDVFINLQSDNYNAWIRDNTLLI